MGRPSKDGIDFFSFDTDFFADDKVKLVRSEFGAKGLLVLVYLFCEIYRGDGYYKVWNDDSCNLTSDGVACGCTPAFISQVVQRFVKRSLFNEGLFDAYGILTSPGIQRRYLRACSTRDEIRINEGYWLLDVSDKKDVPSGILKKITFIPNDLQNNAVNLQRNAIDLQNYPKSRVEENRVDKSRRSTLPDKVSPDAIEDENDGNDDLISPVGGLGRGVVMLSENQKGALLEELDVSGFDYYVDKLANFIITKKAKVKSHYKTILKWAEEDKKV